MNQGKLVTFEGIDKSGKTTQAGLLKERLERYVAGPLLVREPGGTAAGERIRALLLDHMIPLSLEAEILLYAAARAELVQAVIKPALGAGMIVIGDRYVDSSLAYQGYGSGRDRGWIRELNEKLVGAPLPDITFLLDLPVEEASRRSNYAQDRVEDRDRSYHERVRHGYLELAGQEPSRVIILNALNPPGELHAMIWSRMIKRFGNLLGGCGDEL